MELMSALMKGPVEGIAPVQLMVELALAFGLFTLIAHGCKKAGFPLNKLFQAALSFGFIVLFFEYRVGPPLPLSMLIIIYTVAALGVYGWVSSSEAYWIDCRRPIIAVLDGRTICTKVFRVVGVILFPLLVGWASFTYLYPPDPEAPLQFRSYHPAPPKMVTVHSPSDFKQ